MLFTYHDFQIVDLKGLKEDFDPAKQVQKIMEFFHGTAAGLAGSFKCPL